MATHDPAPHTPAEDAPALHSPADLPAGPPDLWSSRQPGTYLLLIQLPEPTRLEIGRLGHVLLPAGWYVYIGSALGGLGARLSRHARREKRPHWHIDRLLARGRLVAVAARVGAERIECATATAIIALPGATLPAPRFGASDCRCPAHLVRVPERPNVLALGPGWQGMAAPPVV